MADTDSVTQCTQSTTTQSTLSRDTLEKWRKSELQKRCKELGLSNIWGRKDQLINMILQKLKHNAPPDTDGNPSATPAHLSGTAPQDEAASLPRHDAAHLTEPEEEQPRQPAVNETPHHDITTNLQHNVTDQLHLPDHI